MTVNRDVRLYFKSAFASTASAPVEIRAIPTQRAGRDPAFQAAAPREPFALGRTTLQTPLKAAPKPRPAAHARLAPHLQAPTALRSSGRCTPMGAGKQHPALAPGRPAESSSRPPRTSSYRERTQPVLSTGSATQRAHPGLHGKPNGHPQQAKLEPVSLVNINFISFKAKLTKPLQCKNVL